MFGLLHLLGLCARLPDAGAVAPRQRGRARIERQVTRALAAHDIARRDLALGNVYARISDEREQIVDDIALDEADAAPVIRHRDLMHGRAADVQRREPASDQRAALDLGARGADRRPAAVRDPELRGELDRLLAEHLRLPLAQPRQPARYTARGEVLGQPERR